MADLALRNGRAVIRRLGSNTIHVARGLSPDWFVRTTWIGPPYFALHNPTVALCGAILRPDHRGLVAMQEGTKVTCRRCAQIDGSPLHAEHLGDGMDHRYCDACSAEQFDGRDDGLDAR